MQAHFVLCDLINCCPKTRVAECWDVDRFSRYECYIGCTLNMIFQRLKISVEVSAKMISNFVNVSLSLLKTNYSRNTTITPPSNYEGILFGKVSESYYFMESFTQSQAKDSMQFHDIFSQISNSLHIEFFCRNKQFLSFLHKDMIQVV